MIKMHKYKYKQVQYLCTCTYYYNYVQQFYVAAQEDKKINMQQ